MAKVWHHMRKSVPLPAPINKGEFHGLREEKSEAKVEEKPSICLVFLSPLSATTLVSSSTAPQSLLPPLTTC